MDALNDANWKLRDEKLQIAYNYGIIQIMRLPKEVVSTDGLALRLQQVEREADVYKDEIACLHQTMDVEKEIDDFSMIF